MAVATEAQTTTKQPSIVGEVHNGYPISELARSMQFYTQVLRLRLIPRPEMPIVGAWLADEGRSIEVHLFESDQLKPGAETERRVAGGDVITRGFLELR